MEFTLHDARLLGFSLPFLAGAWYLAKPLVNSRLFASSAQRHHLFGWLLFLIALPVVAISLRLLLLFGNNPFFDSTYSKKMFAPFVQNMLLVYYIYGLAPAIKRWLTMFYGLFVATLCVLLAIAFSKQTQGANLPELVQSLSAVFGIVCAALSIKYYSGKSRAVSGTHSPFEQSMVEHNETQ